MIKSVVFDVDDTMYDQQQPFRNAVKKVVPLVSDEDMSSLYLRFRHHSDENFPKVMAGNWTLEYMRAHRISQSLKDLDYPHITEADGLYFQQVYEEELNNICLHEEVKKTLDFLAELEIPLGIITNGPTDHQTKKLEQLQLAKWIPTQHMIVSQATGYQKPEKEIFQLAEERFNLSPQETLYVGDNYDNDVLGAKGAGWKTLWFNHRERKIEGTSTCDIEITSFDQLLETMKVIFG
ncbi:HAD family hydrolase [Enterococcus villorum]|uniref:Haloacid dehalogenase n=2 Tax=Enterococcus villorum TaxID=112904 RepID=A0A511J1U9_9ENTE|nr:HAD family hydrolase [Enterococcus villorum]EOH92658.1 HAD hydrolase, family IA [Enterococcus villorum ATCC 700913]EOW75566.1 HAD superfamily hydrolase [Enterococcus villorum ATCC 700913]GEL91988.1 haloacid dehalogenase [Enterococcus villorum]